MLPMQGGNPAATVVVEAKEGRMTGVTVAQMSIFASSSNYEVANRGRKPARRVEGATQWQRPEAPPEMAAYRDRTTALLRKFLRLSVELGRLPSLVGREFFRARVSSYRTSTFEDAVIFAHDMERCLELLDPFSRELIACVVLQEYTQEEAADLLRCSRRRVGVRFPEALDRLSAILLRRKLLSPIESHDVVEKSCQDPKSSENVVSISAIAR
jgi:DNA-directed RNA polymerase specialized sigma24 family protein